MVCDAIVSRATSRKGSNSCVDKNVRIKPYVDPVIKKMLLVRMSTYDSVEIVKSTMESFDRLRDPDDAVCQMIHYAQKYPRYHPMFPYCIEWIFDYLLRNLEWVYDTRQEDEFLDVANLVDEQIKLATDAWSKIPDTPESHFLRNQFFQNVSVMNEKIDYFRLEFFLHCMNYQPNDF